VIDLTNPDADARFLEHAGAIFAAVSPDGQWVASSTWHGSGVKVWEASSGRLLDHLLQGSGPIYASFSPNGQWLATKGFTELCCWEVGSWELVWRMPHMGDITNRVAWAPDSKLIAVSSSAVVQLLDPASGQVMATLEPTNSDLVNWLGFSPDGSQLVVSTSQPARIRIWDLRLIRAQLEPLGLAWGASETVGDWASRTGESVSEVEQMRRVEVLLGERASPTLTTESGVRQRIEQLRSAVQQDPNNGVASNALAWTYVMAPEPLRDMDAALMAAEKAVALAPGDASHRNTLGAVYYRVGRYRDAVEALRPNLRDQQDLALAFDLYFMAMSHHQLGNRDRARDCFDLAQRWASSQKDLTLPPYSDWLKAIEAEAETLLAGEH
jgi:tetratricopeptide (TPR) repeat protein